MERLGLGPDVCLARRPSLVYGRMTGWGQTGPLSHAAGHDSNYTGLSGALWYSSPSGSPPQAPATVIGGGALYLAIGILSGILRARSDGRGQVVDASIVDGTAHMRNLLQAMVASRGGNFKRGGLALDSAHWAGRSYQCKDGGSINLAPLETQFYAELVRRIGLDGDKRFTKGQMDEALWPVLSKDLTALFATRTRDEWSDVLEGTDACAAPVLSPLEAAAHPHMAAREIYATIDGVLQTAPAPRFSATPSPKTASVPLRGAHSGQLLTELGYTAQQAESFKAAGAFGPHT
jgi:crotonobetainyl-CoA:carnitine CoA-transferase CaiB-like acyl-CoA transferase